MNKNYDRNQVLEYNGKKWDVTDFCNFVNDDEGLKAVNEKGGFHAIGNEKAVKEIMKGLSGKSYEDFDVYIDNKAYTVKTVIQLIKNKNYCMTGNGVLYKQDKQGVIPRFVQEWFSRRKKYKGKMLDAEKELDKYTKLGDKKKIDEWSDLVNYYHLLQLNYKILINSVYGYLGTVYSRFYDFDNCVAVTTTGQFITKTVKNSLNGFFEKKWPGTKLGKKFQAASINDLVIYGDTDSVHHDSLVNINDEEWKIGELFDYLKNSNDVFLGNNQKEYIYPKNIKLPYYDEKTGSVKSGNVEFVYRHKVKKPLFRIKTKTGKYVDVTEDHSCMVLENNSLIEKKPRDIKPGDRIIKIK